MTSFIDSAVGKSKIPYVCSDDKKFLYKLNAAENILKARNLKYVSPIGIQQSILMFIFSGRNTLVCWMFSNFCGAKGSISSVKKVLQNSEITSQRTVPNNSKVYKVAAR